MTKPIHETYIPQRTQDPCCYTAALDSEATFCGECGKPLMRCMAIEECGGLLDDHGLCTVCVSPDLQVDAGATIAARVGGAVAIPMSISNYSVVGRPLFITGIWSREAGGGWRSQSLGWERLAAGETRPISITASELNHAGAHNIEILIAMASRWKWREECFAFSTSLQLTVDEDSSGTGPVVNIGGESAGHGNVVYIGGKGDKAQSFQTAETAIHLKLVRADKEERRLGLRGIDETHWVPKDATFRWRGFANADVPADGPIATPDGLLAVGRARTRKKGGLGDVRMLVLAADGTLKEDLSRLISRRHYELYVQCDRLMLRVTSEAGVRVGGEAYGPGKTVKLQDGDTISPLVKSPDALAISIKFQSELGAVRSISMTRHPANL